MLTYLNLPNPSSTISNYCFDILNNFNFNQKKIDWTIKTWGLYHKYADVAYYTDEKIYGLVKEELQSNLNSSINYVYLVLMNSWDNIPRSMPPHTDQLRLTAANYYLQLGGGDAQLIFYEQYGSSNILDTNTELYENLKVESVNSVSKNTWFAFNAKKFHSVENITSKRLCISLCFSDNIIEFTTKNNHLI